MPRPPRPTSTPPTDPPRPRGRRRWVRIRRLTVFLVFLLIVSVVVVSQSGVISGVVLPKIEESLGCEAEAGRVRLTPGGRIVIHDLELRPPGGGLDSEFLTAGTIVIDVNWGALVGGGDAVDALRLIRPRVSLVMDQAGRLDLARLTPRSDGAGGSGRLPGIEIVDGVIEVAERGPAGLRTLASLNVMGGVTPSPDRAGVAIIDFSQPPAPSTRASVSASAGLRVTGEVDVRASALDVTLEGIDLAEWQRQSPPSFIEPFWASLDMSGTIPKTRLRSTPARGLELSLTLDGVTLNLPVPMLDNAVGMRTPRDHGLPPGNAILPMRGVTGTVALSADGIESELSGLVGDLPVQASLLADSLTGDGEVSCRIDVDRAHLSRDTPLWSFVPEGIDTLVDRLGGPTLMLEGHVRLARRLNVNNELVTEASGAFDLEEGTARFDAFPYPVRDIQATLTFEGPQIHIYNLTGFGPSGAEVAGAVTIRSRPGIDYVNLRVTGAEIPIDEHLIGALDGVRPGLWDELVNRASYEAITGEPATAQALRAGGFAPAGIEAGSTIDVSVSAIRDEGGPRKWAYLIDVRSPEAGLLPKVFPYPLIAEELRVRVSRDQAVIRPTRIRSPGGAEGSLSGVLELFDGGNDFAPHLVADLTGLGSFDAMSRAIAPSWRDDIEADRAMASGVIRDLNLVGAGRALVTVTPERFDPPEGTRVEVRIRPEGLEAYPGAGGLALRAEEGLVIVDDRSVRIPWLRGHVGGAPFTIDGLALPLADDGPAGGTIEVEGLDVEARVEDLLLALGRDEVANTLSELRAERAPAGRVDATIAFDDEGVGMTFGRLADVVIDADGLRPRVSSEAGEVRYRDGVVMFDGIRGSLSGEGDSYRWPLDDLSGASGPDGIDLSVRWRDADLRSSLVRGAIASNSPEAAAWAEDFGAGARFDADLRLTGDVEDITASGTITPRSLSVDVDGVGFALSEMGGAVVLDGPLLTLEGVSGRASGLTLNVGGSIDGSRGAYDLKLSAEGNEIPPIIPALLPPSARRAIESLEVTPGGFSVADARIVHLGDDRGPDAPWREVTATIAFDGMSLNPLTPITDVRGTLAVRLTQGEAGGPIALSGAATAERLSLLGLTFTNATADLHSDDGSSIQVSGLRLDGYEGAATGRIRITARDGPSGEAVAAYDAEVRLSRIDFGRALKDLDVGTIRVDSDGADGEAPPPDAPAFRGWLDASASLAGVVGDPVSRRGRGELRIEGGDVLQMPGAVNAMRAANFQGASNEPLDYASAQFHVSGDRIIIEQASVENPSGTFRVLGAGYIDIPTTAIEMVFTPQAAGVLIVSEIFKGLRDEIATPYLTGTLAEPRLEVRKFGRVREMLATIFQGRPRDTRGDQPAQPKTNEENP